MRVPRSLLGFERAQHRPHGREEAILLDEIDEDDKGLFYELIEDTFVLLDRLSDIPKEAPHLLANTVLIDQKAGKAGQTFLS